MPAVAEVTSPGSVWGDPPYMKWGYDDYQANFGQGTQGAMHLWAPYGDSLHASMYGSSAVLMGDGPMGWQQEQMGIGPEQFQFERMYEAANYLSPNTRPGDQASRPSYCESLPAPLRVLFAPCVGEAAGRTVVARAGDQINSVIRSGAVALVGVAVVAIGVYSLVK